MKLDMVHDLQAVYRKLLDSTSRPGLISDLGAEAKRIQADKSTSSSDALLLLALTLLDQEVNYKVYSDSDSSFMEKINQLTYAKPAEADQADYIFVLKDAQIGSLEEAIQNGKAGTLKDPHKSATIITEVEAITKEPMYLLKGPGIKTIDSFQITSADNWIEQRMEKNKEFPLGIDLIFVDQFNQLVSLPRTTQIIQNRGVV